MANEITPLFGGMTTQQGQKVGSGLARTTRREVEQIAAQTEIAAVRQQGEAFLVSVAMTNVSTLVNLAEAHIKVNPATAPFMEQLITNHVASTAQRLNRGL